MSVVFRVVKRQQTLASPGTQNKTSMPRKTIKKHDFVKLRKTKKRTTKKVIDFNVGQQRKQKKT